MTEQARRPRPLWVFVNFGRGLRARGQRIGHVRRVLVDLRTRQVTHLIVRRELLRGLLPWREVTVPTELLQWQASGQLNLRLTLSELKGWSPARAAPPAADPVRAVAVGGATVTPADNVIPFTYLAQVHRSSSLGQQVVESVLPADIAYPRRPRKSLLAPRSLATNQGSAVLDSGTEVTYLSRAVGQVAGVLLHPETRQITQVLIRRKRLLARIQMVPVDGVRKISRRYLYLTMEPQSLSQLNEKKAAALAQPPDDVLAEKVRTALAYHAPTGLARLAVSVDRGRVELRGVVRSAGAREMAERQTRRQAGVSGIRNLLVTDVEIATGTASALSQHAALQDADIHVQSYLGTVTLAGTVASPERRSLAAEVAARQDGVVEVDDQLAVQQIAPPPPVEGGLLGLES